MSSYWRDIPRPLPPFWRFVAFRLLSERSRFYVNRAFERLGEHCLMVAGMIDFTEEIIELDEQGNGECVGVDAFANAFDPPLEPDDEVWDLVTQDPDAMSYVRDRFEQALEKS